MLGNCDDGTGTPSCRFISPCYRAWEGSGFAAYEDGTASDASDALSAQGFGPSASEMDSDGTVLGARKRRRRGSSFSWARGKATANHGNEPLHHGWL